MKSKFITMLFAGFALVVFADEIPDVSTFKQAKSEAKPIVESFDAKPENWTFSRNFQRKTEGMNGTGCLVAEQTEKIHPVARKKFKVVSGTTYRISLNYRSEMVEDKVNYRQELFACRVLDKQGNRMISAFHGWKEPASCKEWTTQSTTFTVPDGGEEVQVTLLVRTKRIGKVWYDNLTIEPMDFRSSLCFPVRPFKLSPDKNGSFSIYAKVPEKRSEADFAVLAECGKIRKLFKISNGIAKGNLGQLPAGKQKITVTLLDMKNKEIHGSDESYVFVCNVPAQAGAVTIDGDGRMIRDGKPFMPVGIFLGFSRPNDRDIFKRVHEAGFNTVQGIGTQLLYHGRKETMLASLQASVREMAKYNLAYMYAIKYQIPSLVKRSGIENMDGIKGVDNVTRYIVNGLKNEPNMLAWYISDENPITQIPEIRHLREVIAECDPHHPSMTLTYRVPDFSHYSKSADYLMVDVYPVGQSAETDEDKQSMKEARLVLEAGSKMPIPLVWVPQIFAWGAFPHSRHLAVRYPTEQEMRSMVLLGTHFDVKAYFFYAYHPIFYYSEERDPGHSQEQWNRVKASAKILNELVPFLLSRDKAPVTKVKMISGSTVMASAFSHDGKNAVVITSDGPGESTAEITTVPGLKSRYGKTVETSPGNYRFTGKNIDSDVLF